MNFFQKIANAFKPTQKQSNDSVSVVRESFNGVSPDRDLGEFLRAYSENEWLYSAVSLIANEMAAIPINLYQYSGVGDKRTKSQVFNHPVSDLLKRPNPVQTGIDFATHIAAQAEIVGNAYILIVRGEDFGLPSELWPLDPAFVKIKWNTDGTIKYYEYWINGGKQEFTPEDIIHIKLPNPQNIYFGTSPAQAAAITIDTDVFSLKWWRNWFYNSARPDFILLFKKIASDARERLERKFREKFNGVKNSHKMAVLEASDVSIHEMSKGNDKDISTGADHRRDRILAAYRVPRDLIGLGQSSNRASIEGSIFVFARFTILPKITRLVEQLNLELLTQYKSTEGMAFEAENPVPEDTEKSLKISESYISGYGTINEARAIQGLPPISGGDEVLITFNKVPLSDLSEAEKSAKKTKKGNVERKRTEALRESIKAQHLEKHRRIENRFQKTMVKLFNEQEKEVLANLSKSQKAVDPLDPIDGQKWIAEFVASSVPIYELAVEGGGEAAAVLVGAEAAFDFSTPAVRAMIADMSFQFATEVNKTTVEQLRKSLLESERLGESIPQRAARVEKVFDDATETRSFTIARTETTKGVNGGAWQSYDQNGVKTLEWLATSDDRTRADHIAADGQRQSTESKFRVGDALLKYPGDPDGPASEVVNCRCTILPIVD